MKKKPFQRRIISQPPKKQLNIKRDGWYYINTDNYIHKYTSFFGVVVWSHRIAKWHAGYSTFTSAERAMRWVETTNTLHKRKTAHNLAKKLEMIKTFAKR